MGSAKIKLPLRMFQVSTFVLNEEFNLLRVTLITVMCSKCRNGDLGVELRLLPRLSGKHSQCYANRLIFAYMSIV